jgi:site-specific DNA recombinase
MNKEKINYFVYVRKSTEGEDRQILSIDGQLQEVEYITKREQLSIVETLIDKKSAASPYNRPYYSEMIQRIKKGEATGIVVYQIDRLVRNHLEAGELQYLLQTGAIKSIWSNSREYRSEDNALLFSIEASVATQYSRDLSVKVLRGIKQKCALGQPPRPAPLGYLNTKLSTKGANAIIPDPDRWHIIRKGFDLLLSRKYAAPQVLVMLNKEYGLRTRKRSVDGGKPLAKATIYRIFTNPFYYGYFYHKNELFKGAYPPMITVQEFDQVQDILGRKGKPRPKKHTFPFTGLMTCGVCGCAITATQKVKAIKQTGEIKSYLFYHCTKRKKNCRCTEKHYTTAKEIESMIIADLHRYQLRQSFKDWAIILLKEMHQDEIDKWKALLQSTIDQEKKLEQELDNLIELRISNGISEEKYYEKKAEKEQLLFRVQSKIKQSEFQAKDWISALVTKLEFSVSAVDHFINGDTQMKKSICMDFGSNWLLKGKKLLIYKREWFEPIRRFQKALEAVFGRLEPEKTFDKYGQEASFTLMRPILRSLIDQVRTHAPPERHN